MSDFSFGSPRCLGEAPVATMTALAPLQVPQEIAAHHPADEAH